MPLDSSNKKLAEDVLQTMNALLATQSVLGELVQEQFVKVGEYIINPRHVVHVEDQGVAVNGVRSVVVRFITADQLSIIFKGDEAHALLAYFNAYAVDVMAEDPDVGEGEEGGA